MLISVKLIIALTYDGSVNAGHLGVIHSVFLVSSVSLEV